MGLPGRSKGCLWCDRVVGEPNRDYLVVRKTGVFRADTVDDLSRICKKEVQDIFSETILRLCQRMLKRSLNRLSSNALKREKITHLPVFTQAEW